jgi:hypothetical protein
MDWFWKKPQPPQHALVFRHGITSDTVRTTAVPAAHYLPSGQIEVDFSYDIPVSDAVQLDPQRPIYLSCDGGKSFQLSPNLPPGLVHANVQDNVGWPTLPVRLPNGTLLLASGFGWENHPCEKEDELRAQGFDVFGREQGNDGPTVAISHRAWKKTSHDNGRTWQFSEIENFPIEFAQMGFYNADGYQLFDGTYVKSGYGAFKSPAGPKQCSFLLSTRDAQTWSVVAIALDDGHGYCEPALAQAPNGDLLCLMRTHEQRDLYLTRSTDNGKTWSPPYDSGLRGSTPWMTRSTDGHLVAVFGRRYSNYFPRTGLWAAVSKDHGQTWNQFPLVDRGTESFQANGTVIPLPDGSCFAVYAYLNGEGIGSVRFHPDYHD